MPSGPTGDHLFVILLGPSTLQNYGAAGQFISVSIHKHLPRRARIDPVGHLEKMVSAGVWKPQATCHSKTFDKINQGACLSKLLSREIKVLLGCV